VIERELTRAGVEAEVVCFGMDGAPTSMKSYRFLKTRYASSFLKIGFDQAGQPFEIEPTDFTPGSADRLRAFNTFRYLYYKTNLPVVQAFRQPLLAWRGGEYAPEFISSAVDVRKITDHVNNRRVARYVLSEMRALAQQDGFRLVLAMDGVRDAI